MVVLQREFFVRIIAGSSRLVSADLFAFAFPAKAGTDSEIKGLDIRLRGEVSQTRLHPYLTAAGKKSPFSPG
jgi:hypothetical protein